MKRTRLKSVSSKRAKQLSVYRVNRERYLIDHPLCEAWAMIWPDFKKSVPASTEIHHKAGRIGAKLNDEADWIAVCRDSHNWIHEHPSTARKMGLLK